jgi:Glycosyl hydrolase family 12
MTSRAANGNDFLRMLLMPALAVGLVVGCAPAKGGGGENSGGSSGQSSGGNSGQNGGSKSGGTTSATGGNNNPSGGNNNPSGGNNNPSGGNRSGGTTSATGGNNNPSGGNNNPSGGNNNPSGGNRSGGTTSATGGNNNPSGGTTTSSGGTTTSSGGTTTSSGGTNPSGGTTSSTGGSTVNPGTNPPGWWQTSDWGVTSANWHGCVWTGVDCKSNCSAGIVAVPSSTTSITPTDFAAATTEGGPYEVSGTVFNDYNSVALLGFDLTDTPNGDAQQCSNAKRDPAADGPPAIAMPSGATGIAINWSAKIAPVTSFRIQIQGVKGATDPTARWCATIKDASGPSFVKFSDFYPSCWYVGVTGQNPGTPYAGQPIDAVGFLVPGTITAKAPFDFTIVGFAPGTSAADAPGKIAACGTTTGTVGSTTQLSGQASIDAATQRAAVTGTDCKKYIINNNNWGNESGTYQSLSYTGNSFTDTVTSGSGGGANVVSFPSIYIGANGQIGGGTFNTWDDSGLPKQISAMKSAKTEFKWSGGSSGGNYNAAYDVWFAKSPPAAGSYNDAVSGFIMVWLYKPGASQPIGSSGNTRTATIAGHTWTVWRGPRVGAATGTDGNGRPVISYVANDSPVKDLSFDLKNFIDDAVANGSADMSAGGGITQAFSSSWYLTDVFAGFEIWSGGDAKGLQDTFTCVVQ